MKGKSKKNNFEFKIMGNFKLPSSNRWDPTVVVLDNLGPSMPDQ